ncbi:hypothetical protein KO489_10185 [Reinekea forsetii]|nr:hypothetical protein [Reinekea forsetii]
MQVLSKSLFVVTAASVALMGCNPEGEGKGSAGSSFSLSSVALKTPTYVLTDSDAEFAATISDSAEAGYSVGMDAGMSRSLGSDITQRALSSFSARNSETESFDCDTGSMTITVSSSDVTSSGEPKESGSMSFDTTFNNCYDDWEEQTVNGSVDVEFSWTGYNPNSNSELGFDTMSVVMEFKDLNVVAYDYWEDADVESTLDGAIVYGLAENAITLDWALSVAGTETNNEFVTTKTTQTITMDLETDEMSGAWVVNGANGTKAEVTQQNNGYSVSVNGGASVIVYN